MDLLSPKTIKELLAKYGAAPLKRMGQNFLINKGVLEKIIEAAGLQRPVEVRLQQKSLKSDFNREGVVLEIGPGLGSLTQELAKRAKKVIAIEKDRKFAKILKETMKEYKNVEIIEGDVLKIDISNYIPPFKKGGVGGILQKKDKSTPALLYKRRELKYKLVANLPYYITSPVIRKFLEEKNQPKEMILMVQKEVAQRICASPVRSSAERSEGGQTARMSLLSVSVQFYADPKIISYVSTGSFWPQPKVDSAILRIIPKATPIPGLHPDDTDNNAPQPPLKLRGGARELLPERATPSGASRRLFFAIVRAGFSAPRKQLAGNLAKGLKIERYIIEEALKNAEISPAQRAETLRVEDWIKIVKYLISNKILNA